VPVDSRASTPQPVQQIQQSQPTPQRIINKQVVLKTANLQPYIANATITKNKNILISKPQIAGNKIVLLNGQQIKIPVTASNVVQLPKQFIGQQQQQQQQQQQTQQIRVQKFITSAGVSQEHKQLAKGSMLQTKKIEVLNNTLIRPANSNITTTVSNVQQRPMTFVSLADAKPITGRVFTGSTLPLSTSIKQRQLVIKTANLKPITLSSANNPYGNLTVKRLNVIPPPMPSTQTESVATSGIITTVNAEKPKVILKSMNPK
jgi:hypothetical protein